MIVLQIIPERKTEPFLAGGLFIQFVFIDSPQDIYSSWVYSDVDPEAGAVTNYSVRGVKKEDEKSSQALPKRRYPLWFIHYYKNAKMMARLNGHWKIYMSRAGLRFILVAGVIYRRSVVSGGAVSLVGLQRGVYAVQLGSLGSTLIRIDGEMR